MRSIIVTGGTSGIGKAVAQYFASQGDKVIIIGQTAGREAMAKAMGSNVTFKQLDVTQEADVKAFFGHQQKLDVLVNSAGIYIGNEQPSLESIDSQDFEKEWRVNTFGTMLMCKYALPLLKKSAGNIVNVSSVSGMVIELESFGYTASKAAVNMLTKTMALAHAQDGVRINAVCPGPIDTPMLWRGFGNKLEGNPAYEEYINQIPLKRRGAPADVVQAVAYLSNPDNTFVTGSLVMVDGGWSAMQL